MSDAEPRPAGFPAIERNDAMVAPARGLTERTRDAAKTGFEPRKLDGYLYFRVRPSRIQAWREANEIPGRTIMRDGAWRDPAASRRET